MNKSIVKKNIFISSGLSKYYNIDNVIYYYKKNNKLNIIDVNISKQNYTNYNIYNITQNDYFICFLDINDGEINNEIIYKLGYVIGKLQNTNNIIIFVNENDKNIIKLILPMIIKNIIFFTYENEEDIINEINKIIY